MPPSTDVLTPVPDGRPPGAPRRPWRVRAAASAPVQRCLSWYRRHEATAPAVFFFGGVTWDALTLRRIDAWFDNAFLLTYLVALGGLIAVATLEDAGRLRAPWLRRHARWYPAAIQFFMGALFSAYVVFYFQSASLTPSSLFLLLLVGLLVANEFLHRRLLHLYVLLALYYLAVFSFLAFFIPVALRQMHGGTFLAAGLLSLGVVGGLLVFLYRRGVFARRRQAAAALGVAAAIFGLVQLFYVQNWIPPVPLALRHGGIFHHVERTAEGFALQYEQPPWHRFWADSDDVFHRRDGEPVYCFTAVFAPTRLAKEVVHHWQVYDEAQHAWLTTDRIDYEVVGGRDGGYRGFTRKRNVHPGRWRVDVETEEGLLLSRIRFQIEPAAADHPPALKRRVYR